MVSEYQVIKSYFSTVWQIVSSPVQFYKNLPTTGGLSGPLTFALVTHWLGSALGYLTHLMSGSAATQLMQRLIQLGQDYPEIDSPGRLSQLQSVKERLIEWSFGAGSVVIDPFLTLISILITSAFVFAGARILVSPSPAEKPEGITYESAVRIISYGMAPQLLCIFPFFGVGIASLYTLVVTVIGAREVYRVGTGRAIVIALFPKIFVVSVIFAGISLFLFLVLNLFASFFSV